MRRPFSAGAWVKRLLLRIVLVMAVFWGGGLAVFSIMPVPFSAVMVERQLGAWLSGDFGYVAHSDWVSMDEISPFMGLAVIAAEDQKFPEHWGFDVAAIEKALAHNEHHENRVRGASTLSQQTAKNLFLWDGRSWVRAGSGAHPGHGNGLEQKAHSDRVSQRCRVWRRGIWCRSCITTLF